MGAICTGDHTVEALQSWRLEKALISVRKEDSGREITTIIGN